VLKSIEAAQRAAIDAVRKFVDTIDEALPTIGDRPSRRETVINAALEMADRLVTTQYEFLRSVVRRAGPLAEQAGRHEELDDCLHELKVHTASCGRSAPTTAT
jgi:hypothetical protein